MTGVKGLILIFLSALSTLSAVSSCPREINLPQRVHVSSCQFAQRGLC